MTLLVAVSAFLAVSAQSSMNTLTEKEKKEGWQLLFNGKNLDGWRLFQGKAITGGWKVI